MGRALLKMQRRQVAKSQSIRWKQDLRHLAAKEVSAARARSQAHEIGSILESFLFWLSFIFFQVIRIISTAALKAFRKEADIGRNARLSSTLPRGTTAGWNGRTNQDLVVNNEDSMLSQEDSPSGVKKQVPSITATAVQVDQPQHLPVQAAREVHHVFIPTVAMPDPFSQEAPRFNRKNISRFIRDYEGMCWRYYVSKECRLVCLPDYCEDIYAEAIQVIPELN